MVVNRRYFNDDTIAAIATAPHALAAVGIIRISGAGAWVAAQKLLRHHASGGKWEAEKIESHKLYRCKLVDHDNDLIDDALFVWMRGNHSFTGEDCIELQMHGNPLLLQRALATLVGGGLARLAHPGEFSFRAFQNGKLDLSQAEAVMDLIASRSEKKAEQALQNLLGSTKNFIHERKKELLQALAAVEVDIDFSDQGLSAMNYNEWSLGLSVWCDKISSVRARFAKTALLRDGIRVAILGAPNGGKSTLFNRFLGEDRSIVSDIAGTTRDVVRESFSLGSLLFLLSDTAGLRDSPDQIEKEGIARSLGELRGSDLVLIVVDISSGEGSSPTTIDNLFAQLKDENKDAHKILILNKIDLLTEDELNTRINRLKRLSCPVVPMCAKTGRGLDVLEATILSLFEVTPDNEQDSFAIGRTRHSELLGRAVSEVRQAIAKVRAGELLPDLLAADLRSAMSALGEITGEVSSEDVLNFIFAEFCIGK